MCRCKQERHGSSSCVELPGQRRSRSLSECSDRFQVWAAGQIKRLQVSKPYRQIPYADGLHTRRRELLLTLACFFWGRESGGYEPIRLSSRAIAAIFGLGQPDASRELNRLVVTDALELVEPAAGRRVGAFRIVLRRSASRSAYEARWPDAIKLQPVVVEQLPSVPASPPVAERGDPERASVVVSVRERINYDLSATMVPRPCDELGVEDLEQLLRWLLHRDTSGFHRGPAAAFVSFVHDNAPEPPALARSREAAEVCRCQTAEHGGREERREAEDKVCERRLAGAPDDDLVEIRQAVCAQVAALGVPVGVPVYRGVLWAEMLRQAGPSDCGHQSASVNAEGRAS